MEDFFLPAETIEQKKQGNEIKPQALRSFIDDFLKGDVTDYQMSAFLMATYFKGMTKKEAFALTEAMLYSGEVLDLSHIPGKKIDKHSTGGVGDKTSLIIGPIVAACGVKVPMIAGRGLGHTGGTLDKLESIPGFNVFLDSKTFIKQVNKLGVCIMGQTPEICPADKRIYAIRDVTATVDSIPLICASIMSKKLAEGIDGLVIDLKTGTGAFMKTPRAAEALAKGLIEIARKAGKSACALITDMNQPLGLAVGNSLEVQECVDVLSGSGPQDLVDLSLELSAYMIKMGLNISLAQARKRALWALESGEALDVFEKIVKAQGGKLEDLPRASRTKEVLSPSSGFVTKAEAKQIGLSAIALKAGRLKASDQLDLTAGIQLHKHVGEKVKRGEKLATMHYNSGMVTSRLKQAEKLLKGAYQIGKEKPRRKPLILKVIG